MEITSASATFHVRRGRIKDGNGKDLKEAEEIKKRWQEYTEELYKMGLNDLDKNSCTTTFYAHPTLEMA